MSTLNPILIINADITIGSKSTPHNERLPITPANFFVTYNNKKMKLLFVFANHNLILLFLLKYDVNDLKSI